jgi:hypothetical protein
VPTAPTAPAVLAVAALAAVPAEPQDSARATGAGVLRTVRRGAVPALLVAVAVAVPLLTLPALPALEWWPALLGLVPWIIGKYVLCPLRWQALSESGRSRAWHVRAFAEAELCGLLTPGHVGADAWRVRRLTRTGMSTPDAVAEAALDRLVGALGLAAFVGLSAAVLPVRLLLSALAVSAVTVVVAVLVGRRRPDLVPRRRLPRGRALAVGVALSAAYQLSIVLLLLGTVAATGHVLEPLALLGAFGASQLAAAVPGPHGASPRDGALVVALAGLGLPWSAAFGAVALKATLAWLPALLIGGVSLLLARRLARRGRTTAAPLAPAAPADCTGPLPEHAAAA